MVKETCVPVNRYYAYKVYVRVVIFDGSIGKFVIDPEGNTRVVEIVTYFSEKRTA